MNRHEVLFQKYVNELTPVKDATLVWWQRLIDAELGRGATPLKAEDRVRERWPMGPTSHPLVLATYRKFYLACEQLNEVIFAEYSQKVKKGTTSEDGGWGIEEPDTVGQQQDEWGPERPIDPPTFLVDMLFGRHDDLGEFLGFMVFSPIGEIDNHSV